MATSLALYWVLIIVRTLWKVLDVWCWWVFWNTRCILCTIWWLLCLVMSAWMLILIKAFHFAQHYSRDMDDYHVRINLAFTFPFSSCNIGNLIIASVSYFLANLESVSIYCPIVSAPPDYIYLVCRMSFERGFQIVSSLFGQRYQYLGMWNKPQFFPLGGAGQPFLSSLL